MKHLKLFFALFAMLALGVGNAWGAEKTITLTYSDFGLTTSYAQKTATVDGIGFTVNQGYKGSGNVIQMNSTKGAGVLYNTTSIAGLKSITVNVSSGSKTYTITSGTAQTPSGNSQTGTATKTFSIPSGDTYFQLKVSGASYFSSIVITYDDSNSGGETPGTGGETPDPDPDPTPDPETPGSQSTATLIVGENGGVAWTNGEKAANATVGDVVFTALGSGSNDSKYYSSDKSWRFYTANTSGVKITTPEGSKIVSVIIKWKTGQPNTPTNWSNSGTSSPTTFTPNSGINTNEVSFTRNSSANFLAQEITVNYETSSSGSGSEEPVASVTLNPSEKDFGTVNVGDKPSQEFTITTENTTAELTASIDNTTDYAVSAIAGNKVTVTYQPKSAGTHSAVLTIKAGEEATATVNLTGKAVQTLEGTWILVTDASSLNVGDKIIIAAKESDVALSTTQASNNRPEVAITKNDNTITATSETQVLTLQAGNKENTLALYTGDGYLYAASSGSNWLRTETTLSDNSSWSIAVAADGTATLIAQGTNTRNTLYYNKNSKIFSCYSTTQQEIAIYKNTNGKQLAGLAYATTKYLTKLGDAFTTPTLTNPNSLTVTYSSSDNNVATVDNTGTVTIKAAGVVVITAAFAGDASYLEGSASYTIGVTEHAGTQADPYSVADARRVIDVMETAEGVYATGIVSEIVTAYNSEHGNITYNISIDGTTTADQLQAYRGKGVNGENFSSADDIKVGDEVVVKGNLKKHETTYEFDADNQLVSLKRDKQQAGLAYEEKEHTANVGEDFTEPTLTNPNSLTVTYNSSNTALATVDATTGEVSILAAGKVTITASSAADATYAAGSASYNITITDPSLAVAQLPFTYNSGKADIETTAGITQEGLGSDYTSAGSPKLKFDHTGDNIVICFGSQADELSYDIKGNPSQGTFSCTFAVQESEDGSTYTDLVTYTTLETTTTNKTHKLAPASRYVKFVFTEKSNGNVALGNISITKPDLRAEAGIAWNPATVSLTVGDAFTAPTFNNPNGLSGITFASSNEALATVNNAGAITLVSGKTGTATITATFADGHADYKPAEATCVITVSPKSEKVVILAQYNGQWYALKAAYLSGKTDRLDAIPVNYVGGKLYNVAEEDKASIEWSSVVEGDKVSFINDGKYLKGKTSTTLLFEEDADGLYQWDNTTYTMTIGTTVRSFLYNGEAFRNFAVSNAGKVVNDVLYSSLPVVTAPVYATGDAYSRSTTAGKFGTICLPFGSNNYTGAEFYELVQAKADGVVLASVETLEAGVPYIFKATGTELAVYSDGTTAATAGNSNGLYGTFTDNTEVAVGNYILKDNALCLAEAICWVNAYRAYIVMGEVPTNPVQQMPGRRYVSMGTQGTNATTGVDNVVVPEGQVLKVIENGQLIIIRGGEKFNVQGQKL